jgi:hypothetical protein
MQFNISIINVQSITKPTAKGSYTMLDVAFKRLDTGKIEGKKIMSFTFKDVFKAISTAINGQEFTITTEKNAETTYWDWTAATPMGAGQAESPANAPTASKAGFVSPKSTYETPEERAARQVLIVRQSSLSNAIESLSDGKKLPSPEDILALATRYTNWVFQKGDALGETPPDGWTGDDDDIPM